MDNLSFLENQSPRKRVAILPIPLDLGSDNSGTHITPSHLLQHGLKTALERAGFETDLLSEIPISQQRPAREGMDHDEAFAEICKVVARASAVTKSEVESGSKILAIGGDHSIAIGTIAGAAEALRGDMGVVWIDAHADVNTHDTSLSGNVHGMASAAVLGFGRKDLTDLVKTKIKKEHILYVGLKDLDQAEVDIIRAHQLATVTMLDLLEGGFSLLIKRIRSLQKNVNNIWVSIDVDAIDERDAPASAMATLGGLTYREITNALLYIGKTSNVIGIDIAEMTPHKDIGDKTTQLIIELAAYGFGSKYSWYSNYMAAHSGK